MRCVAGLVWVGEREGFNQASAESYADGGAVKGQILQAAAKREPMLTLRSAREGTRRLQSKAAEPDPENVASLDRAGVMPRLGNAHNSGMARPLLRS
jgi:hypothetical protein